MRFLLGLITIFSAVGYFGCSHSGQEDEKLYLLKKSHSEVPIAHYGSIQNNWIRISDSQVFISTYYDGTLSCRIEITLPLGYRPILERLGQVENFVNQLSHLRNFSACLGRSSKLSNYPLTKLEKEAFEQSIRWSDAEISSPLDDLVSHDPIEYALMNKEGSSQSLSCFARRFSNAEILQSISDANYRHSIDPNSISEHQILRHCFDMVWWQSDPRDAFGKFVNEKILGNNKYLCRSVLERRLAVFGVLDSVMTTGWTLDRSDHFKAILYNPALILVPFTKAQAAKENAWNLCKNTISVRHVHQMIIQLVDVVRHSKREL